MNLTFMKTIYKIAKLFHSIIYAVSYCDCDESYKELMESTITKWKIKAIVEQVNNSRMLAILFSFIGVPIMVYPLFSFPVIKTPGWWIACFIVYGIAMLCTSIFCLTRHVRYYNILEFRDKELNQYYLKEDNNNIQNRLTKLIKQRELQNDKIIHKDN